LAGDREIDRDRFSLTTSLPLAHAQQTVAIQCA